VAKSIRERFLAKVSQAADAFQASLQQADPYRAPMKDYTWGSNKGKAIQARLYRLAALHNTDQRLSESSLAAAMECAHYIHGVNPLGLVYLTNMTPAGASHSAATMFHAWFARARAGNG
jgi:endoglucanase